MNDRHAHLLCMGPEYALKRYSGPTALHGTGASAKGANSGSTRSLPPEGAVAFLGAARREAT